jgi:hypothetical protein
MVALVRATVGLLMGLVLGEVGLHRREGLAVHELHATALELPPQTVLPHGALHLLANDPERLARLTRRVERRIAELPLRADAAESVKKLVELASLGPSPTLSAQVGLFGARFDHLQHPVNAQLQLQAARSLSVLVDCVDSGTLAQLAQPPARRVLLDVHQLCPSGR